MENTQRKHTQKERLKSTLGRESGNPKEMAAAAPTVRPFTSLLVLREDGAEQLGVGLGAHDLVRVRVRVKVKVKARVILRLGLRLGLGSGLGSG